MIFAGDIAIPYSSVKLDLPKIIRNKNWIVNLEGSLIKEEDVCQETIRKRVFNSNVALDTLLRELNIQALSLANNHIEDCAPIAETTKLLDSIGLPYVGAGNNILEASKGVYIEGKYILSFGWDVIKCSLASQSTGGVNPYIKDHVIKTVKKHIDEGEKIICFFHWGYELEEFPLPYDRELAHILIDIGVLAVIGCHAHRVQQIEIYKGCPIVYGLGNFLFPHNVFWNGRLKFPEFTRNELAFEITEDGEFVTHWFDYDICQNRLRYLSSERIKSNMDDYKGKADYSALTSKEYDAYFRNNRYHKKMLPVFRSHESPFSYSAKRCFVIMRRVLIDLLVKLNVKAKK